MSRTNTVKMKYLSGPGGVWTSTLLTPTFASALLDVSRRTETLEADYLEEISKSLPTAANRTAVFRFRLITFYRRLASNPRLVDPKTLPDLPGPRMPRSVRFTPFDRANIRLGAEEWRCFDELAWTEDRSNKKILADIRRAQIGTLPSCIRDWVLQRYRELAENDRYCRPRTSIRRMSILDE